MINKICLVAIMSLGLSAAALADSPASGVDNGQSDLKTCPQIIQAHHHVHAAKELLKAAKNQSPAVQLAISSLEASADDLKQIQLKRGCDETVMLIHPELKIHVALSEENVNCPRRGIAKDQAERAFRILQEADASDLRADAASNASAAANFLRDDMDADSCGGTQILPPSP